MLSHSREHYKGACPASCLALSFLLFLSACKAAVPAPPEVPQPPTPPQPLSSSQLRERIPLPGIPPGAVFLSNRRYQPDRGLACLTTTESYHNLKSYFPVTVGEMIEDVLQGLGYTVQRTPSGGCELVVKLDYEIELLPATYFLQGLKPTCYSGIEVRGQISVGLSSENEEVSVSFGESKTAPSEIKASECYQIQDNPLVGQWREGFVEGLVDLWGPSAYAVVVGADWPPQLESLQREAYNRFGQADASTICVECAITALSHRYSYQLLQMLNQLKVGKAHAYLVPILLENMEVESLEIQDARQSLLPIAEIKLLQTLAPDEEFAASTLPRVLMDLAVIYQEDEEFMVPAHEILAGMGSEVVPAMMAHMKDHQEEPEAARAIHFLLGPVSRSLLETGNDTIPTLMSYLYHHQDEPAVVAAAGEALRHLIGSGYRDEVARRAGHPLCYLLFRMEKGETPEADIVRALLHLIFPEQSGSDTKAGRYFALWQSEFGGE